MDGEILHVVQAMAMGLVEQNDCGYECLFCGQTATLSRKDAPELDNEIDHKADCPIVLARYILFKNGTPVNIYKVNYESQGVRGWQASSGHTLAISEQEAIRHYQYPWNRNIHAEFVRMFPELR